MLEDFEVEMALYSWLGN